MSVLCCSVFGLAVAWNGAVYVGAQYFGNSIIQIWHLPSTCAQIPETEFQEPHAVQLDFHGCCSFSSSLPFFLPFKMNDWRFFNVSQNQFLLCLVSIILTVAAKKTSKEIFVFINWNKNKKKLYNGIGIASVEWSRLNVLRKRYF